MGTVNPHRPRRAPSIRHVPRPSLRARCAILCLAVLALTAASPAQTVSAGVRARGALGLVALLLVAWGLGAWTRRREAGARPPAPTDGSSVPWRVILWGLTLQMAFALFVLRTPVGTGFFSVVDQGLNGILDFAEQGARFVFGDLVGNTVPVGPGQAGTNAPVPSTALVARTGAFFAFNVLTTIIFVSSLMAVLYHVGVMQRIVGAAAWVMHRTMGTSGAETLATAGNVFVGLMEAPLFIRPYLATLTRSELMALMTGGFATVSGGTLAAYTGMLGPYYPGIGGHLVAASVMSAPAALVVAKLMLPERDRPRTGTGVPPRAGPADVNVVDAAARGAHEGLWLALNVAAMLIAFLALLHLLDALVGWGAALAGFGGVTLSGLLGHALAPVAWAIGIPWSEAGTVGRLVGVKTVLNEFVAFVQLTELVAQGGALSPRSATIATYALAGFANFGSVAMQIAGIGELAPERRKDLARLGVYAMVGGTIAALTTAAVAGMLL